MPASNDEYKSILVAHNFIYLYCFITYRFLNNLSHSNETLKKDSITIHKIIYNPISYYLNSNIYTNNVDNTDVIVN